MISKINIWSIGRYVKKLLYKLQTNLNNSRDKQIYDVRYAQSARYSSERF